MTEGFFGLLGVAVGLWLYYSGRKRGQAERREEKPAVALTPEEQRLWEQAVRERYNFLSFEGDPLK